ncbi:MAG: lipoate--protein ligase [Chloroflexota bacterium]|nr:lipoate--protein ligase [Chloroflexota bacterium]
MLFVDNANQTDSRLNLALEEHLVKNLAINEELLLFYINAPSIIIGRNQNTLEEINTAYVKEHDVQVVRRLSGGGAVYHDLGNLNFSFITPYRPGQPQDFKHFTQPVIRVLHALGVEAELSGRNDILVDGRKISGNAQYRTARRMFSHGTLLFDTQLAGVVAALNVSQSKITSKGLKSVRNRVANISEFLAEPLTTREFRARLLQGIFNHATEIPTYELTEADWDEIHRIKAERYDCWEWNYGRSPEFNVQHSHRFPAGEVDVRLNIHQGEIQSAKIYGDFLGDGEINDLEQCLIGTRYDRAPLAAALAALEVSTYFGGVTREEFLDLIY